MDFEQHLQALRSRLDSPVRGSGAIDTRTLLFELSALPIWGPQASDQIDFISKRLDINGALHLGYSGNGAKFFGGELTDTKWLELALALFGKAALWGLADDCVKARLKRFNVLFKALDIIRPAWFADGSDWATAVDREWNALLHTLPQRAGKVQVEGQYTRPPASSVSSVVPLTVLFYEGPNARAYLATFKSLGLKPKKIIQLVAARDIQTRKPVGKWMPQAIRQTYAASTQRRKIHYWPHQLLRFNAALAECAVEEVVTKFSVARPTIEDAHSLAPLSTYSDRVDTILIDNLADSNLRGLLADEPRGTMLFTGGGIVPRSLLSLPHLRFLHIHPGFLPDIRGADCTLWSTLVAGRPSASCFYMSPGIDTGDIVMRRWLPAIALVGLSQAYDPQTVYRAVYSFIDPWVRATVLRALLQTPVKDFSNIGSIQQDSSESETFHFMHKNLKAEVFDRIIKIDRSKSI